MAKTKNKKAYTVDTDKKVITIDDSVKATSSDKQDIQMYLGAGYKIRHKSAIKSVQATERAKKQLTDEDIIKALCKNDEAYEKYVELKNKAKNSDVKPEKGEPKISKEELVKLSKEKDLLYTYEKTKATDGFFSARKWYKQNVK